jgi:hypothetical protein
MAYKPFKMKGHTLPGINQNLDNNPKNVAEQGLPGSSPFQDYKKGYYGEGKSKSPNKWVQFIPMALSALSSMKKSKEKK